MRSRDARWAYEVLGLPFDASPSDVREVYRDLITVWHPDRFQGNARLTERATQKTQEINAAYALIRRYEQSAPSHSAPHASHPPPPRSESTNGGRTTQAGRPPFSESSEQGHPPWMRFGTLSGVIYGILILGMILYVLADVEFVALAMGEILDTLGVVALLACGAWFGFRALRGKQKK